MTTKPEVLAMAREAGALPISYNESRHQTEYSIFGDQLERFAALIAAAEREEIAAAIDSTDIRLTDPTLVMCVASLFTGVAKWIRARSAK